VGLICACLPILAPIFPSCAAVESVVGSVTGFFDRDSAQNKENRTWPRIAIPSSDAKYQLHHSERITPQSLYPLDDEQSLVTHAQGQRRGGSDIEAFPLKRVIVNGSMERRVEHWERY